MNHIDPNELLSRFFSGEATAEERAEVDAWRQASAENQSAFAAFEKIWKNAAEQLPQIPSVDQAWQELAAQLGLPAEGRAAKIAALQKPPQPMVRKAFWSDRYVWAAAAIILLAFATMLYQYLFNANPLQKVLAAYGQRENIELPDGSFVQLNSGSEIQFQKNFSDSVRLVTLAGEGYFEIKHEQRPFVVHSGNAQITVLGTKFGVWSRNEQTRVAVREGRVAFGAWQAPQIAAVVLTANQTSSCGKDGVPEAPKMIDAGHLLGWLEGKIVFDQTSLAEVIAELQRVYNVSIAMSNPALGSHTITGSFQHKPVESVLSSICLTLNLHYAKEGERWVISE